MADTNHNSHVHASPAAVTYAQALLDLANEQQAADTISQELKALRQIIHDNPLFRAFLSDPAIGEDERTGVLQRTFAGKVTPLMMNFLGVLNAKGRLGLLAEISKAYDDLLEAQMGRVEVDVTVAQRLTGEQLEQVRQKVSAALKKEAVVHQYVDESIIGGMVLRVQDKLIDASSRYQLQAMREQLLAARPK